MKIMFMHIQKLIALGTFTWGFKDDNVFVILCNVYCNSLEVIIVCMFVCAWKYLCQFYSSPHLPPTPPMPCLSSLPPNLKGLRFKLITQLCKIHYLPNFYFTEDWILLNYLECVCVCVSIRACVHGCVRVCMWMSVCLGVVVGM